MAKEYKGQICILSKSSQIILSSPPSSREDDLSFANLKGVSKKEHLSKTFLDLISKTTSYNIKLYTRYYKDNGQEAKIWLFNRDQVLVYVNDIFFFITCSLKERYFIKLGKNLSEKPFIDVDFEKEKMKEDIEDLKQQISQLRQIFENL
jgi:hypothetical protein